MRFSSVRFVSLMAGIAAAVVFASTTDAWVLPLGAGATSRAAASRTTIQVLPDGIVAQPTVSGRAIYVEGEVLIKYKAVLNAAARRDTMSRLGVQELRNIGGLRVVQAKLPQGVSVERAMQTFAQDPMVEYVQPNYIYKAMAVPTDPLYGRQWGLKNIGQTVTGGDWPVNNPGASGADLNIEQAWDHITDCSAVVVAVVDTGVNYLHRDLAGNMWDGGPTYPNHGYDFVGNGLPGNTDNDPLPQDASGHGTHVAATIAAAANNGVAGAGVCWRARIMAVRALSDSGGTSATVTAGVNFAVTQGAHVINMSLGGSGFDQVFSDAITNARMHGVIVVVAAGNDGLNNDVSPTYPCNFTQDNLLCVAALDQAYGRAGFSNYGATSVDVGAPGTNVLSAWPGTYFEDDFAGWTKAASWASVSCDPGFGIGPVPMLVNPVNWCSNGTYANSENAVAYRNVNVAYFGNPNLRVHRYEFLVTLGLQANDFLGLAFKQSGGDPFVGGTVLTEYTSSTSLVGVAFTSVGACFTNSCSLGVRLRSDTTTVGRGAGLFYAIESAVLADSADTFIASGTSMATPHVAGVVAMVRAFNPAFTYSDTIDAIKNGGRAVPALAGTTVTGRAVDAFGALQFIKAPTGVTATVQ